MKRFFHYSLAVLWLFCGGAALAQESHVSCDAEFEKRMNDQAWMAAEREVEMAEALLLKPDSVLEYSCFLTRLQQTGANKSFGLNTSGAVLGLTGKAAEAHIQNNYAHKYGGNLLDFDATGCADMAKVWKALKCVNFKKDYFMSFDEFLKKDPRALPEPCENEIRDSRWEEALAHLDPAVVWPVDQGGPDPVAAYSTKLSADCSAVPPVPSGVIYEYDEDKAAVGHSCIVQGCYYNGSKCVAGP